MNKKNALKVENLTKIYSKKSSEEIKALNNLNLEVKEGEIFGLLGPNGAGKTTFLNILAGTVIKNSGKVNVWGFDLDKNQITINEPIKALGIFHINVKVAKGITSDVKLYVIKG